jgi:hypothetical protein
VQACDGTRNVGRAQSQGGVERPLLGATHRVARDWPSALHDSSQRLILGRQWKVTAH